MQNKSGQISIVYLSILVLFSISFLAFVFFFSDSVKENSTEELGEALIDDIFARIERNLLEIKYIYNTTNEQTIIKETNIPQRIGDEIYEIRGKNNELELVSFGDNSFFETKAVDWWAANLTGISSSSNGKVILTYNTSTDQVVIT